MIKHGGWARGGSYTYYREHGWSPIGAIFMMTPTPALLIASTIFGIVIALLLSYLVRLQ